MFRNKHIPTCSVCMIAKNEGRYLLEWIAYYSLLGFDRIIIYNNNSEDHSEHILHNLHKRGIIEHRKWSLGKTESPQITAYEHAISNSKTDWILFVDADEFLVFNNGNLRDTLASLHDDNSIGAICVNWRVFGSSNLKEDDGRLVVERFVLASNRDFEMNNHLKSFLRVKSIGRHIDMHLSNVDGRAVYPDGTDIELVSRGRSKSVCHQIAQINHYFSKTFSEYLVKKGRGQAGIGENSDLKYWYTDEAFFFHDRNDEEDLAIRPYVNLIKSRMNEFGSDSFG